MSANLYQTPLCGLRYKQLCSSVLHAKIAQGSLAPADPRLMVEQLWLMQLAFCGYVLLTVAER